MLRECLQLHNIHQDKKAAPVLKNVQSILSELSADLSKMRLQIKIQKQELDQVQKLKESVLEITEMTRFAQNNLPPNLPKVKIKNPVIESVQPKQRVHAPVSLSPACPSIQELKNASASLFLPSIEYLNIQEFQAIPRYMKGRLKYDQVNDLIAQMNAAMEAKYRLMHSAKSKKISEAKFKRVQVMKSQENKAN
ncbi:hypothetical protein CAPTEDRAFT_205162 [Capitella teleta]|uniref:SKA complex subunit 1 n=1 Tax=Capitella teleta TaxID=283909 RepID=R7VJF1_CAPTE|nr:hypothetical protein CAPTEDRAFT_205162 [Capitella teleta]|eukprot:ELU16486.1 hypothetical protein CAPTEDRAFT_205162 [Capitella teleta]